MVKPVPLKVAESIVTGAVPVDVSVRGSLDDVFTVTFPKAKLAVLMVNPGTVAAEGFVPPLAVLVVLVMLLPDALPHPEIATATREQADNANSFTHKLSGMWSDLRLHRKHEPNTFSPL